MSLIEDFRTKLAATSAVTAIVAGRMYQNYLPQPCTLPAIVYGRRAKELETGLAGEVLLAKTEIALECIADDPDEAEDLADVVQAALHATSGTWGSSTIRGAFVASTDDDYVEFPKGSDMGLHVVAQVVNVHHVVS